VLAALADRRQIEPLTARPEGLSLGRAYQVTAAVRKAREARGERVVGRKIGFTNRTIWDEYGVHAPIWSYVYDTTVLESVQNALTAPIEVRLALDPKPAPVRLDVRLRRDFPGLTTPLHSKLDFGQFAGDATHPTRRRRDRLGRL
jgi:2-oxo-3-hexenedioate decarboxylase